jgi:hypothetical protein
MPDISGVGFLFVRDRSLHFRDRDLTNRLAVLYSYLPGYAGA